MRPAGQDAFIVFAQRADARIDIDAWNAHAIRFFATRIGLTSERRYAIGEPAPNIDVLSFVVTADDEPPGVRSTLARPCGADEYALAEAADGRLGGTGLALLARRCQMVWLVSSEGHSDRLSLRLATILASILLGPIFDSGTQELFGVKTARARLLSQTTKS